MLSDKKNNCIYSIFICLSVKNNNMWTVGIMTFMLSPEFRAAASVREQKDRGGS